MSIAWGGRCIATPTAAAVTVTDLGVACTVDRCILLCKRNIGTKACLIIGGWINCRISPWPFLSCSVVVCCFTRMSSNTTLCGTSVCWVGFAITCTIAGIRIGVTIRACSCYSTGSTSKTSSTINLLTADGVGSAITCTIAGIRIRVTISACSINCGIT